MQSRLLVPLLAMGLSCLGGCGSDNGLVELQWEFVDGSAADRIFPRGARNDTCSLPGRRGNVSENFALVTRLHFYEPDCGLSSECEAAPPVSFPCAAARGAADAIPARDTPYLLDVQIEVQPTGGPAFDADPACILVPGPRERTVAPGRITDLAVYQLVVAAWRMDGSDPELSRMDLEACGAP